MVEEHGTADVSDDGLVAAHLVGLQHVGIAVRNLDRSLAWYRQLFGLIPEFVEVAEGPIVSEKVQMDDVRVRFAWLRLGDVSIELLEYERPVGADFGLRNCDVGAVHICLEVDDIGLVGRLLRDQGVPFSGASSRQSGGPLSGRASCYFRDPDGIQFELAAAPK